MCSEGDFDRPALRVRNLSKRFEIYRHPADRLKQTLFMGRRKFFQEFQALADVSFEVSHGECFGVIGANGAGKSTLLQLITGTLTPSSGTVELNGRVAALLELGSGFNPEFTGRDNVFMNGAILGLSSREIADKYEQIAAFADIGDFIDRPVKTYSSGMMVRLAFAVNAFVDAEILIVDEALAVGDIAFQAKCFKRFQALRDSGTTVILVTHDLATVTQFCTRAMLLRQGVCAAIGSPIDVVNKYKEFMAGRISDVAAEPVAAAECAELPRAEGCTEYGDRRIEIVSYAITDARGRLSTHLWSESEYTISVELYCHCHVESPIAAFTIRDLAGNDIVGTNTLFDRVDVGGPWSPGERYRVSFVFRPRLKTGWYLLSLGCTEVQTEGLAVCHRLYDVCRLEVSSSKPLVGVFDPGAEIRVEKRC